VPSTEHPKPSALGPVLSEGPALETSASGAGVSLAIVSLNPSSGAAAPLPDGSRDGQFSAGPIRRTSEGAGGGGGTVDGAALVVPGLLIRNGAPDAKPTLLASAAPTSAANLRAALRSSVPDAPAATPEPEPAKRVSSAPDPMLNGRTIYAMTVQMPNVTSYSGSWLIWFAERQHVIGAAGSVRAPVPLRKVDPKYIPSAVADGIEGKVRLAAVIRTDGRVDSVRLLQHLDDRLDQSAAEAMHKWEFQPALRNGRPVDVDAVVEIPFRLTPKVAN
jgi:TonB family protein